MILEFRFWILDFGFGNPQSKIRNPKSLKWFLSFLAIVAVSIGTGCSQVQPSGEASASGVGDVGASAIQKGTEPEEPRVFLSHPRAMSAGRVLNVSQGDDLQAAFEKAQPGDKIVLEATAAFVGNFVLPKKRGDDWISIVSSTESDLPLEGTRVMPGKSGAMPKILTPNSMPAVQTAEGAHHYRLEGLEIAAAAGVDPVYNVVLLGRGDEAALRLLPHDLTIDRCYIHGAPTSSVRRGVALNGSSIEIINSYLSEFHEEGVDSQAILGWNGPGPFRIVGNYLEASGENVLFGGVDPAIKNLVPADIEIRRNHFFKPLSWRPLGWTEKNLLELKNARRVLVDGNVFENSWLDGQDGTAIVLTVRNQNGAAPWSVVEDIRFTNNIVRSASGGIAITGFDNNFPSQQTNRILIRNNLFYDINGAIWGGGHGQFLLLLDRTLDIKVDHNTVFQSEHIILADGEAHYRFVFSDNIVLHNQYGIFGGGAGIGNPAILKYFPDATLQGNVIVGGAIASYPRRNFFPRTLEEVQFVDLNGGNYRLAASSPYNNKAKKGRDPGSDIDELERTTAGVVLPAGRK